MKHKISLGVNIDHAATLRQVRGRTTSYPDLVEIAQLAKKGGADQITIHLREDRRHIQDADVVNLCKKSPLPINLEMAVNSEILKIALKNKPRWVCFVPEKRAELTTEGGLDIKKCFKQIKKMTDELHKKNIKVSFFIEPSIEQVELSAHAGADAIEFHTGHWVLATGAKKNQIWDRLVSSADLANWLGLRVHAGHGLDYAHAKSITKLNFLQEVNIGHSLICYALAEGLQAVTKKMKNELK
ncbi:MAG: pyridoxine 5'-phosphate synthase [Bdellovibrio sp.]|nr:pyridoxine 5'-phosphate synthase [Bdellovibrio sp.]